MHRPKSIITAVGLALIALPCFGQTGAGTDQYVTREEYNKVKSELNALQTQMQQVLQQQQKAAPQAAETDQALDQMEKEVKVVKEMAAANQPGESRVQLVGLAYLNFTHKEVRGSTAPSRNFFAAQISPTFLYRPLERLIVEAEPEMKLTQPRSGFDDEFTLELEQMHIAYILNDYVTIDAGQFLNPANVYGERLHQVWIEKTPNKSLALANDTGDVLPQEHLGFQVRGAIPAGPAKFAYALFVANAPKLVTDPDEGQIKDGFTTGNLDFDSFANVGNRVAYGGHVGLIPFPGFEIGYGFEIDQVKPDDAGNITSRDLGAQLQTVDANYVMDSPELMGTLDLKAQWAWSHVDHTIYIGDSAFPGSFHNNRSGGFARIAYRPSKASGNLKNLEPVFRYEMLKQRNTPSGYDERRYTFGLDYWLSHSAVMKVAYQPDRRAGAGKDSNSLLLQWAVGF